MNAKDIFIILSESNQAILMSTSKNIAEHVKISDHLIQLYEKHDFLDNIQYILFPFEVSSIFTFFDFAPLLNRLFQVESVEDSLGNMDIHSDSIRCKVKYTEFNELEKKAYIGLIKHPELSDSAHSEKIGCSRQVFSRIKYRFMEEKLLKKRRIANLEKLGLKVLSMTHSKFNPLKPLSERRLCNANTMKMQTPILKIARDPESVMLTAYKDFEEFKEFHHEYVSYCAERNSLVGDPLTINMSIPRLYEIKWLVYEPLVRDILNKI